MNENVISVSHVSKVYGKKGVNQFAALNDISFSMKRGGFVAVMGPSGSGKTTLLNLLSTLDTATEGEIKIGGSDITKMDNTKLADFRAEKLGFIFQDYSLIESLKVFENIALPLKIRNEKAAKIKERVHEVAGQLGISDLLNKFPAEISGGQKQRTAAARALVHKPEIILGDEPTGALDSKNALSLLKTLTELNQQQGVSILMVTHDAQSASFCERVLFIQDGKIYKELKRSGDESSFYKEILNVLAALGTTTA